MTLPIYPIAKLLYGLSTINKGKGICGTTTYEEVKDDFSFFFYLNGRIMKEGMDKEVITYLLENETAFRAS